MSVITAFLAASLEIVAVVLNLFVWVLVFSAILSWLVAFDVVNPRNKFISTLGGFAYRLTEPVLRPIRRFVPSVGGMDLSPLVLILIVMFLQSFLGRLVMGL